MYWFIKGFFITLGTIFLFAGFLGFLLPVIPALPFVLLAAACYLKGSRRLYYALVRNKLFGKHLQHIIKYGISPQLKILALICVWTGAVISGTFIVHTLSLRLALAGTALLTSLALLLVRGQKSNIMNV